MLCWLDWCCCLSHPYADGVVSQLGVISDHRDVGWSCRIAADQEVDIIFVPFWTDTKNSYLRVRHCARARAIENECYVAITGSVGNLPKVENLDVQYAQSSVFSPSDFSFPHDAIVSETTPNTEMTLIVDLDLDKLTKLQNEGSVRNYLDRRRDLYRVQWIGDK